jgi:hypothetical protein
MARLVARSLRAALLLVACVSLSACKDKGQVEGAQGADPFGTSAPPPPPASETAAVPPATIAAEAPKAVPVEPSANPSVAQPSGPEPKPRAEAPPPKTEKGAAEVRFESNPSGANIELRQGATVFRGLTPYVVTVPAGVYSWAISKEGFLPDSSPSGGVPLLASKRTISIELSGAGDWSGIVEKADAAFNNENCEEAVRLYRALDKPRERGSKLYERWVKSRMALSRCYQRIDDANGAVEALRAVRDDNPGGVNWRVVFELGVAQCTALSVQEGRRTFSDLDGQTRNRVSVGNKSAMRALAHYGLAYCGFQDFDTRSGTPSQALANVVDADFERFFKSAERAKEDGTMSPDVLRLLNESIELAEKYRGRLPGG